MADGLEQQRLEAHEIRKNERSDAMGITGRKAASRVTVIESKVQFSKAEQDLLRSQALTVEDNPWQKIQFTNKFNSLAPTYDPTVLSIVSFQNNTLRQCIAAMMANIDGTGFEIKRKDGGKIAKVVSADSPKPSPDPPQPTPNPKPSALPDAAMGSAGFNPPTMPPKEKPVKGKPFPASEGAEPIMVDNPEIARIKAFFDEPYPGVSFMTMRKKVREDLESTGNAYIEVIRDASGKIALLNVMDSKLTRLIRHDDLPVAVTHTVNRTGEIGDEQKVTLLVHERRFVQIIGLNARFFKAYRASRELNAQTGIWQNDTVEKIPQEQLATEVLHFTVDRDVLTPYGIPRWINQMPSVMGSRKAEELNLEFFESGGVPPMMVMIQGGTLSAKARDGLTNYLAGQAKFKQRGVLLEIAPSGGDLNSASQVKANIEKLGDQGGEDSKFEKYDDKCCQRVRSAFRMPAVLIGLEESYNYACYDAQTETLTDKGWLTVDQFKPGTKVAVVNPTTLQMTYEAPKSLTVYEVENVEMYHYKSKQQDFMVTPNHTMLFRADKSKYRIGKIEEMAALSKAWTRRTVEWLGGRRLCNFLPPQKTITKGPYAYDTMMAALPAELFLEFLGWFVSEGHTHPYGSYSVLTQHESRGLNQIRTMANKMESYGYRVRESKLQRPNCYQVMIGDPSLVVWLDNNVGKHSEEKRFPEWVLDLPRDQLQVVFDSLMAGDGSWVKNDTGLDSGSYCSTSETLINQVQIMALKLGYATKRMTSNLRNERKLSLHRLAISKRDEGQLVTKLNLTRETYTGKVHCYTVSTGVYVTRRNGCVAIQGNTVQTAVMMAEEQVFHPERQLFDEVINSTIMKELDPTGTYVYESKRMTAKFLDEQIKALTLAAPKVEGKSFVEAINDVAGLDLKFDQAAADMQTQQQQQSLLMGGESGNMAGTGGGSAEGSTGAGEGGTSGQGNSGTTYAGTPGRSALGKSSTSLGTASASINKTDVDAPLNMQVAVTPAGKIRKLDQNLLTDLASDMAGLLTGERHFLGPHVDAMHKLIKSMTPALQRLFADNVARMVISSTNDPNGARELISCASDVLTRLQKTDGGEPMASPKGQTLYVSRPVVNARRLVAWAKSQGFDTTLAPEDMHVTVAYSKSEIDCSQFTPQTKRLTVTGGKRDVSPLGPKGAIVLKFASDALQSRWKAFRQGGASWDWDTYQPHVTLTYSNPHNIDPTTIKPYEGPIVLGPEIFGPVEQDWGDDKIEKDELAKYNHNHDSKNGEFSDGKNSQGSDRGTGRGTERISAPPIRSDGRIELTHYSNRAGLRVIDPKRYGSGLRGAEAIRQKNDKRNWVNRSYYGIGVGQPGGYAKEQGLGSNKYTTSADPKKLYDLASDPDNLYPKNGNVSRYEKAIKSAGYEGYWRSHPQLGMVAAIFNPKKIESFSIKKTEGEWIIIEKFNPYHDERGRFTTGESATYINTWGKPKDNKMVGRFDQPTYDAMRDANNAEGITTPKANTPAKRPSDNAMYGDMNSNAQAKAALASGTIKPQSKVTLDNTWVSSQNNHFFVEQHSWNDASGSHVAYINYQTSGGSTKPEYVDPMTPKNFNEMVDTLKPYTPVQSVAPTNSDTQWSTDSMKAALKTQMVKPGQGGIVGQWTTPVGSDKTGYIEKHLVTAGPDTKLGYIGYTKDNSSGKILDVQGMDKSGVQGAFAAHTFNLQNPPITTTEEAPKQHWDDKQALKDKTFPTYKEDVKLGDPATLLNKWTSEAPNGNQFVVEQHQLQDGPKNLMYVATPDGKPKSDNSAPMVAADDFPSKVAADPGSWKQTIKDAVPTGISSATTSEPKPSLVTDPLPGSDEAKPEYATKAVAESKLAYGYISPNNANTILNQWKSQPDAGSGDTKYIEEHQIPHGKKAYIQYTNSGGGYPYDSYGMSQADAQAKINSGVYSQEKLLSKPPLIPGVAKVGGTADYPTTYSDTATAANADNYAKLNATDKSAIGNYTGAGYSALNKFLRFGKVPDFESKKDLQSKATKLENALHKTEIPENVTVFRGIGDTGYKLLQQAIKDNGGQAVGVNFTDKGFSSSSVDEHFGQNWGSKAVLRISAPKGTPGLYVDAHSQNKGEHEYLFPPGIPATITKTYSVETPYGYRPYFDVQLGHWETKKT